MSCRIKTQYLPIVISFPFCLGFDTITVPAPSEVAAFAGERRMIELALPAVSIRRAEADYGGHTAIHNAFSFPNLAI
jgi:hypothetical protein